MKPTIIKNDSGIFVIKPVMEITMVEGKVCQAFSGTSSSMTCYICQTIPKEMNDFDRVKSKVINIKPYDYGLSALHAKIHFMENFLHIAYRLDFKKWRVYMDVYKDL